MMQMRFCDFVTGLYQLKVNKLLFWMKWKGLNLNMWIEKYCGLNCTKRTFVLGWGLLVAHGVCEWLTQSKQAFVINEMEGIEYEFVNHAEINTILLNSPSSWSFWGNWKFENSKNMLAPTTFWIIWWDANTCSYALDVGSFKEFPLRIDRATMENSP